MLKPGVACATPGFRERLLPEHDNDAIIVIHVTGPVEKVLDGRHLQPQPLCKSVDMIKSTTNFRPRTGFAKLLAFENISCEPFQLGLKNRGDGVTFSEKRDIEILGLDFSDQVSPITSDTQNVFAHLNPNDVEADHSEAYTDTECGKTREADSNEETGKRGTGSHEGTDAEKENSSDLLHLMPPLGGQALLDVEIMGVFSGFFEDFLKADKLIDFHIT